MQELQSISSELQENKQVFLHLSQDIKLQISFIKEDCLEKMMGGMEEELRGEVKELKRVVTIKRRSDLLKF